MQLGVIQFLLGMGSSGAGALANGPHGDGFSQLLGDAGTSGGGGEQAAAGLLHQDIAASTLLAQELNPAQLAVLQRIDGDMLTQPIGPQEARALLNQLASMPQSDRGEDGAFDQLKQALEDIETTGEPVELAQVLEQLPVVQEQAESPAQRAPLMQRMLSWVQHALPKQKEAPQPVAVAAATLPDATTQSLQATTFRDADPAVAPADEETNAGPDAAIAAATTDLIVVTPMAQTQQIAMPEWVRKLGEDNSVPVETDEAIPALTLPEETGLPEVNLPRAHGAREHEPALAPAHAKPAAEALPTFSEHLNALPEQLTQDDAGSAPVTQVDAATGTAQMVQPGSVNGANSVNTPTHATTAHLAPHRAAAEQVQVAITTATRDGLDSITMQLEPADLGRVEVRMETGLDGRTQLSFVVDKAETMDALARDARSLERSLQEAGIQTDAGSMQFNLRQQSKEPEQHDKHSSRSDAANDNGSITAQAPTGGITRHYTLNVREGVDIHA